MIILKKSVPIGFEDFKRIIDGNMYYVDKSFMIKNLIDNMGSVNLFTRPRRFGKTLNLSMIRRFFEEELDENGEKIENAYLFDGLDIAACGEEYMDQQGRYPVINLSLKAAKQPTFEMAVASLVDEIAKEYKRHAYILSWEGISENDKTRFRAVMNQKAQDVEYAKALDFLSSCLAKYHGKRTIILLDEYDVPLANWDAIPRPYWSNTSSNSIVKELVENADSEVRQEIEKLIAGGTIKKPVYEDITYDLIYDSQDNLWNFLYFTGYLKAGGGSLEDDTNYMKLMIPNTEIRTIYKRTILTWFDKRVKNLERSELIFALEKGDCEKIETFISKQLLDTISFYDYAENYYHGFLAGILKGAGKYLVVSNRESGTGRPDILLKTPSVRGAAVILELKVSDSFQGMEQECNKALKQVEEMDYEAELRAEGYDNIKKYGVSFYQKECMVRK